MPFFILFWESKKYSTSHVLNHPYTSPKFSDLVPVLQTYIYNYFSEIARAVPMLFAGPPAGKTEFYNFFAAPMCRELINVRVYMYTCVYVCVCRRKLFAIDNNNNDNSCSNSSNSRSSGGSCSLIFLLCMGRAFPSYWCFFFIISSGEYKDGVDLYV